MAQAGNDMTNNYLGNVRPAMNAATRSGVSAAAYARFQNISTARAYLLTQGYTNAQLDVMTENDINFAVRRKSSL